MLLGEYSLDLLKSTFILRSVTIGKSKDLLIYGSLKITECKPIKYFIHLQYTINEDCYMSFIMRKVDDNHKRNRYLLFS